MATEGGVKKLGKVRLALVIAAVAGAAPFASARS
jgi:hypothetical protein